jgi:3-oxoacyl-[acyl-carrier-protein] synthase II
VSRGRRVLVTGLGTATCLGLEVERTWRRALAGESGIRALDGCPEERGPLPAAGKLDAEDWATLVATFPDEAKAQGERRTLFALWAASAALVDAHFTAVDAQRCGVVLGAGLGIVRLEDEARWRRPDGRLVAPRLVSERTAVHSQSQVRNPSDRAASVIARKFGFSGVSATITSACASATQAIGLAYRLIQRGDADLVVAGGADSMINPVGLVYFVLLGAASTSSAPAATICRPFDRRRSGLVMGEGAGVAVLEAAEHALARGARAYVEIAGYGSSLDGHQVTAPEPTGAGAARAMRAALGDAGLEPAQIDYVNAHGTGTRLNDVAETRAIKSVFGAAAPRLAISSSKPLVGHLLAGCGGPEFVFTVLSVQRDEIHPTINLISPDPECDLDFVAAGARRRAVRAALSNSFGFGGQNACLAVKKAVTGGTRDED